MSNLLEVSETEVWETYEMTIGVNLGELEQPIINTEKQVGWDTQNTKWTKLMENRKFVVKSMVYSFNKYKLQEQLTLNRLEGVYFLKGDKRAGSKEETITLSILEPDQFNDIVNQIPAKLHDYAKEKLKEIETILKEVLDKGVITNA